MTDNKTRIARIVAALFAAASLTLSAAPASAELPPEENFTPMEFLRDLDRPTAAEAAAQADAESSDDARGESNDAPLAPLVIAAAALLIAAIAAARNRPPAAAG